jgi:precorrin-4 methylase
VVRLNVKKFSSIIGTLAKLKSAVVLERQLTQQGDSSHNPVVRIHVRDQTHEEDVVGGMSRSRQHTATVTRFVQRAVVEHVLRNVIPF